MNNCALDTVLQTGLLFSYNTAADNNWWDLPFKKFNVFFASSKVRTFDNIILLHT